MTSIELTERQDIAWGYLNDKTTSEILYGGSAGGGKTFLGCLWILSSAITYPKSRWLIGRTKLTTLRQTTLKTLFEIVNTMSLQRDKHYKYNSLTNTILFYNGSEILLKDLEDRPSDPNFDDLGSLEITGAFIDECNQVSENAKNIITSRIRFKLQEFDIIGKIFLSCNPTKNWVYNTFYKPHSLGNLSEDKKFIQALVTDNKFIDPSYRKNLEKLDIITKQRLLYGNWDYEDEGYLIPFVNLYNMFNNSIEVENITHLSIDVARFGKDSTVVILWDKLNIIGIERWNKLSITESYTKISEIINKWNIPSKNIVIDSDGVGGGLTDMLSGTFQFINNSKPVGNENYQNLKTQCYYKLIEKINDGLIKVYNYSDNNKLLMEQELQILRRKNVDSDGKIQIISKDDIKKAIGRSPDISDSMAYRMVWELGNYVSDWTLLF